MEMMEFKEDDGIERREMELKKDGDEMDMDGYHLPTHQLFGYSGGSL